MQRHKNSFAPSLYPEQAGVIFKNLKVFEGMFGLILLQCIGFSVSVQLLYNSFSSAFMPFFVQTHNAHTLDHKCLHLELNQYFAGRLRFKNYCL